MHPRYPFSGFALFLASGILIGNTYGKGLDNVPELWLACGAVFIVTGFVFFRYRRYSAISVSVLLIFLGTGFLSVTVKNENLERELSQLKSLDYSHYEGVVTAFPEKRKKSLRIPLDLERVRTASGWIDVDSKALVYLPLQTSYVPRPGEHLVVTGKLDTPRPPLNPGEFDYKKFLKDRGILWTAFLPDGTFATYTADQNGLFPGSWSLSVSKWADDLFRTYLRDDRAYGLVKAMLLGRRDDLHVEQVDDYTASGTIHILSVSGMHVGLIFLVLRWALAWLKRLRGGKFIYLTVISSILFFYALVTGFAPTVQRSAFMCIVLVFAEVFRRGNNPVNTLSFSALLILLADPMALFDLGFQLSYAAMLGIFLFYKPIEGQWQPENRLMKSAWQVTAMSFAAQLTTFPLSLYYFHQFPTYFWLVNPFVILFTNGLLPLAMVMLLTALFHVFFLTKLLGYAVEILAFLTDFAAGSVKSIPGYLVENLYLDKFEVCVLYVIILLIWWVYESRRMPMLKGVFALVLVLAGYGMVRSTQKYRTAEVVFYSIPKHSVVSVKTGDSLFILADNKFATDTAAFKFYIKNYAINKGILHVVPVDSAEAAATSAFETRQTTSGKLIGWRDRTIVLGDDVCCSTGADYTMIGGNRRRMSKAAFSANAFVLLSGEVPAPRKERLKKELGKEPITLYDLMAEGAYSIR